MAEDSGRFWIEDGPFGVRLNAKTYNLTSDCLGQEEIDASIRALKTEIDAMGEEMKRLDAQRPRSVL